MIHNREFIEGMEYAMRICRNLASSRREIKMRGADYGEEAETCAGVIRIVQVEIGSGRMQPTPFTPDELNEIERIS